MSPFSQKTTAEEAVTVLANDIRGKNILITGVSLGSLGAETARVLAPYAKTIIMASRNQSKIDATIAAIKAETPSASFKSVLLDLGSFKSIRKAAAEVNAFGLPLHVVMDNAALPLPATLTHTEEGFEGQLGTNYIGHFLFNELILPSVRLAVKETKEARFVVVSSMAHAFVDSTIRFDDLFFEKNPSEYTRDLGYAQSKTANILYARELAKKLAPEGILAFSCHPGVIRETAMGSIATDEEFAHVGLIGPDGKPAFAEAFKTLGQGAATQVVAAFDPSIKSHSGAFLDDSVLADEKCAKWARDEEAAAKLWTVTKELIASKSA